MKRILLFGFLAIAMAGCQKKAATDENVDSPTGNKTDKNEMIKTQKMAELPSCKPAVVIDGSKMKPADLDQWKTENDAYICHELTSGNFYYIDLSSMPDDADNKKKAKWLEDNGDYVDFTKSYPYIINTHTASTTGVTVNSTKKLTVSQIKNAIGASVFTGDKFDKYVQIEVGSSNVKLTVIEDFDPDFTTYSVPFFRALVNGLDPTDEIEFNTVSVNQNGRTDTHLYIKTPALADKDLDAATWP